MVLIRITGWQQSRRHVVVTRALHVHARLHEQDASAAARRIIDGGYFHFLLKHKDDAVCVARKLLQLGAHVDVICGH